MPDLDIANTSASVPGSSANVRRCYPVILITLCACFLFYKYIMQVSPSIMTNQLMKAFHVHGLGLGNLAATFFYSYMITQFFVGILLDRFSPRLLTSLAILVAGIGTLLFAEAQTLTFAIIGRLMMGVGAAFATVSYMKFAAIWFEPKQFAFVAGLLATAAMLGAVMGEGPLSYLVGVTGWRETLLLCAAAGIVLALLFYLIARDKSDAQLPTSQVSQYLSRRDVVAVLSNKQNWLLAFYSGLAFTPVAVFGGLWGNPYLEEAYQITRTQAATYVSFAFIGLAIGGPVLGWISSQLGNRSKVMRWGAVVALATLTLVIYCPGLPLTCVMAGLFLFGFASGAFMLGFAIGKEINAPLVAATVVALINTGDALLGSITEPLIGKFLDVNWNGSIVNGVHFFTVSDFHIAFLILPLYLLITLVLTFFIRES